MPNFPLFWNRQHLTVSDINSIFEGIEESQRITLQDFHKDCSSKVLTSNYGPDSCKVIQDTISASLKVYVRGGIAYSKKYNRVSIKQSIIGETQTSISANSIKASYPIVGVSEVFLGPSGIGLNYYTGGSFDPLTSIITTGTALPSITSQVYVNYDRMPSYTFTDPPTGANGTDVTRIDLLYAEYSKIQTSPRSLDFIDENRNLYQEILNTRNEDSFIIKKLTGIQSTVPIKPVVPTGDIVPLAYIHLRNNPLAIYDSDQGAIRTGFIEDARGFMI